MGDQQITCGDCGGAFVFTESERAFYETKGLSGPPKRCKPCRQARKAGAGARTSAPRGGAASRGGARPSGGRPQSPGGWGRLGHREPAAPRAIERARPEVQDAPPGELRPRKARRAAAPTPAAPGRPEAKPTAERPAKKAKPARPRFDVTCVSCGTAAQVPFKPIDGRQIFCQACYRARRGDGATGGATAPMPPDASD